MKVSVKEMDGQRSMEIEVTGNLPDSIFLSNGQWCMEFDRAILTRALSRAIEEAAPAL